MHPSPLLKQYVVETLERDAGIGCKCERRGSGDERE